MAVANIKSNNIKSKDVMQKTIEGDLDQRITMNNKLKERRLNGGLERSLESSLDNDSLSMPPPPTPIVHAPPVEGTDASASLTDFNARHKALAPPLPAVSEPPQQPVDMQRPFHNIGGKSPNQDNGGKLLFPGEVKVGAGVNGLPPPVEKLTNDSTGQAAPLTTALDAGGAEGDTNDSKQLDTDSKQLDTDSKLDGATQPTSDSQTSLSNITENGDTQDKSLRRNRHQIRDPIAIEARENGPPTTPKKNQINMMVVCAESLVEYKWPLNDSAAETFMIQEQVSQFLDILSFKRKYPDFERRTVEKDERTYLLETFPLFTCSHFDYGITALRCEQLHELMSKDYPNKFKEYAAVLRKREQRKMNESTKGIGLLKNDKKKLQEYTKSAAKSASEFNSYLMKERREERMAYFDLQTSEVHYPTNKWRKTIPDETAVGKFPVALIAGQFQDYYKSFTSEELFHLPLNSARLRRPLSPVIAPPTIPDEIIDKQPLKRSMQPSSADEESTTDSDLPLKPSPSPIKNKVLSSRSRRSSNLNNRTPARKVRSDKGISRSRSSISLLDAQFTYPGIPCNVCIRTAESKQEDLVKCTVCERLAHPTCLELTSEMVPMISTYDWQCMECKTCFKCTAPHDEDKMMFCDHCDRGFHTYCVNVTTIPNGRWECPSCCPITKQNTPDTRRTRQK